MSWMMKLYETYNNSSAEISQYYSNRRPLLPIYHTTVKANIQVAIDDKGTFLNARMIEKDEAETIIPCTEKSASRTRAYSPHGLGDKLQYVARDYSKYGKKPPQFKEYLSQLKEWAESKHSHFMASAVYTYVSNNNLIEDIIAFGISIDDYEIVVRWIVEKKGLLNSFTWTDDSLQKSWIKFQQSMQHSTSLCYVTGNETKIAATHPKYIRYPGDGAKLISSNDTTNYTYLGRFSEDREACQVGLEVTEKAHNALKWLISKQGKKFDTKVVLSWAVESIDVPKVTEDTISMIWKDVEISEYFEYLKTSGVSYTGLEFAKTFNEYISGYSQTLDEESNVVIIILDSASPGRLAVTYYREMKGSDFLNRVKSWHTECYWRHSYKKNNKKTIVFFGAPSPEDISEAMHGKSSNAKLRQATIERIIPCIIDGKDIPVDIIQTLVNRSKKRSSMEKEEFNKLLSITCALYNKKHVKEGYTLALQRERTTRDYLYGRLLAISQEIERWALNDSGASDRLTTAERLMHRFAERPSSSYRTIELALLPYKQKLGGKAWKYYREIEEIMSKFSLEDFNDDSQLKAEFLLGYYCQQHYFRYDNKKERDM